MTTFSALDGFNQLLPMMVSMVESLGTLAFLVLVYSVIERKIVRPHLRQWLLAALFTFGTASVMFISFEVMPGVIVDARTVVLGLAGPFGGTFVALTAAAFAGAIRLWEGGIGALAGLAGIAISAGAGIFFHLMVKPRIGAIRIKHLLGLASLLSLSVFSIFFLPEGQRLPVFVNVAPTVILSNFIGVAFLGLFLLSEQKRINKTRTLQMQADIDPLTGLLNRRAFNEAAHRLMNFTRGNDLPLSLIIFDCDFFKRVNDEYGHSAGDKVLVDLADVIREEVRRDDIAARFGGEEFVILMLGTTEAGIKNFAERLRLRVQNMSVAVGGGHVNVTVSAGVAEMPATGGSISDVLKAADGALYRAKNSGRNQVVTASSLEAS